MKIDKKGQISIIIILTISIVLIFGIYFVIKSSNTNDKESQNDNIYKFTEDCIKKTAIEVIFEVGGKGGYYTQNEKSTSSEIPYYNANNLPPNKQIVEDEISKNIKDKLTHCTNSFIDFKEYNINEGNIKIDTGLKDNNIIINAIYPLDITKGKSTTQLKDFNNIEIPLRLKIMRNAAEEISLNQVDDKSICLTCLGNTAEKYDIYVDITDYEEGSIIILKDKRSIIDENKLLFMFAIKNNAINEDDL